MMNLYKNCQLCPRNCQIDRLAGAVGYCGETSALRMGAALIHRGEEPPLVGTGGSGTIFVSGCNLGCAFCQNYQISQGDIKETLSQRHKGFKAGFEQFERLALGREISSEEFSNICKTLQENGAENINIVTGSHAIPAIIEGLVAAKEAGVRMPVLWNSSGYENAEALELLKEHIDIFLPDLKTLDEKIAAEFFNAPDYPDVAKVAILKMLEMAKGDKEKVIIRHLILPGFLDSTLAVLRWFADNAAGRAQLSIMSQYTPIPNRKRPDSFEAAKLPAVPNRFLSEEEYKTVLNWLNEFGIEDGFCQELVTGDEWLPDFRRFSPFSSELSVPVWHFGITSQF